MDTLTHAIIGATVARATASKSTHQSKLTIHHRVWLGGLAASFPDIDYITYLIDPLSFISDWHRAETHSFILLPFWALLLGFVFAVIAKRKHHVREAIQICGLAIGSHILSDMITSWGTQIFAPLSNYRIALGTTFVIDPYFTLIIFTGLIIASFRHSRLAAQTALFTLIAYIGFQAILKQQVHDIAQSQVARHQWQQASIYTMPQPFSPFNWKIIISEGEQYHMAYLDLIANDNKPLANTNSSSYFNIINYYRPVSQLRWLHYSRYGNNDARAISRSAWQQAGFERYRRFAKFPAFIKVNSSDNTHCVWFMDLRFSLPQHTPAFSYASCTELDK